MRKESYKGATAVTYSSMFLEGGLNNIIGALMIILAARYSKDVWDIALLVSAKGLGTFITLYLSGIISDKRGRKGMIQIGHICFAIFGIGMMLTSNYYTALIFSFIGGLGQGFMDAPAMSILFDVYKEDSGPMIGLIQVFFGGGGMVTSIATGILIGSGTSYKVIFGFYLLIGIIGFILTLVSKFPKRDFSDSGNNIEIFKHKPSIKREGVFIAMMAFVLSLMTYTITTWIPTYIQIDKGVAQSLAIQGMTFYMLGSVLGSVFLSILLRRLHSTQLLITNSTLGALFVLILILTNNLALIFFSTFMMGFLIGGAFSLAVGLGGELFPEKSGTMTGMTSSFSMVGGILITFFTGKITPYFGIEIGMWIAFVALIIMALMSRKFRNIYLKLGKKVFKIDGGNNEENSNNI